MLLAQFPTDVWACLSRFLPGPSVLRLRSLGNARLRSTLEASAISLHFRMLCGAFPRHSLLLQFKNLHSLVMEAQISNNSSWKFKTDFFASLPQTMQILRLAFPDMKTSDINALPRSLTDLEIHSWEDISSCIAELPQTLISFSSNAVIGINVLPLLPPYLTHLSLYTILTDDAIGVLPRGLKSLVLLRAKAISDHGIWLLPQNLTRLGIRSAQITNSGFDFLPKTLTELDLIACEALTSEIFRNLPPPLVTFLPPQKAIDELGDDEVFNLPKGLQGFHVNNAHRLTADSIACFPDSFFAPNTCYFPSRLHKHVVTRYMQQITDPVFDFPHWMSSIVNEPELKRFYPSHLTHVTLSYVKYASVDYFAFMPQNLRHLDAPELLNLTDAGLSKLPPNLEHFSANLASQITDAGLTSLPPKLTTLMLNGAKLPTDNAMALLPRTLTVLGLGRAANISAVGIEKMPRSLTYLDLSLATRINQEAIKALPPKLETVWLSAARNVVDDDIKWFPRSLTFISLSTARKLTPECGLDLPPNCKANLPFDRVMYGTP